MVRRSWKRGLAIGMSGLPVTSSDAGRPTMTKTSSPTIAWECASWGIIAGNDQGALGLCLELGGGLNKGSLRPVVCLRKISGSRVNTNNLAFARKPTQDG